MSIRRSHTRQSKQLKRMDIADRRSNAGLTYARGRARWFPPRDRRKLDPCPEATEHER